MPSPRSLFDVEPFWRGEGSWGKVPAVDIADTEKAYEVTAELPGMDEKNVEVKFANGVLTIKGEKKEEKEERKKGRRTIIFRNAVMARSSGRSPCRTASMPTRSMRRSRMGY